MSSLQLLLFFLAMIIGGVILEGAFTLAYYKITHKNLKAYHFTIGRYVFLLILPLIGSIVIYHLQGISILRAFLFFAVIGPIFEWAVGFAYKQIMGRNLWSYYRYSINRHTSLLAIPFWGLAGILFYLFALVVK